LTPTDGRPERFQIFSANDDGAGAKVEDQLVFAVEIHGGLLKTGKGTQAVRVPVEEIEAYKRRTV
jgi:hypothetical protein